MEWVKENRIWFKLRILLPCKHDIISKSAMEGWIDWKAGQDNTASGVGIEGTSNLLDLFLSFQDFRGRSHIRLRSLVRRTIDEITTRSQLSPSGSL